MWKSHPKIISLSIFCIYFLTHKLKVSSSNASRIVLNKVVPQISGKFSCEVSADAPSFQTHIVSGELQVVGECLWPQNICILAGNQIFSNPTLFSFIFHKHCCAINSAWTNRISRTKSHNRWHQTILQYRRLSRNKLYVKFINTAGDAWVVGKWCASTQRTYYKIWNDNRFHIESGNFHIRIKATADKWTFLSRQVEGESNFTVTCHAIAIKYS